MDDEQWLNSLIRRPRGFSEKASGTITDDTLDCLFGIAEVVKTFGRVTIGLDFKPSVWLIGFVFYRNMIVVNIGPVSIWTYVRGK